MPLLKHTDVNLGLGQYRMVGTDYKIIGKKIGKIYFSSVFCLVFFVFSIFFLWNTYSQVPIKRVVPIKRAGIK